jgi:Arc/MetJ-type ribon-helix-helix transcriptional regulator
MDMKLIDKSALVAEIEKLVDKCEYHEKSDCDFQEGINYALDELKGKIDTLEVKEVDLDKEYKELLKEDPFYNKLVNDIVGKAIARHFFELGLKL